MQKIMHLLATDLDGTLAGEPSALKELLRYFNAQPYEVQFIYVTGRHLQSALALLKEEALPQPEILIADIGTSIYDGKTLQMDKIWDKHMKHHWKPEKIKKIAETCEGLTPQQLPDDRRLSYTVTSTFPVKEFQIKLKEAGISHTFVFSGGRYVDILPQGSGKGNALSYVLDHCFPMKKNVLIAGDSGNDEDMLTLGYPAVIVGNAHDELQKLKGYEHIYWARKHCAGGIQEAWETFYPAGQGAGTVFHQKQKEIPLFSQR
jgi:sucrose-6F-phosphate phosphohydrolase